MQQKIAIQGIKGSFHYQAAQEYFGNQITIMECNSFDKVAQSLLKNEADLGVMAIENSIAGSILPNYALIDRLKLNIMGEHYIDIQQNLMALSGQDLNDLKEVHSHPMALLQCKQFFENYPHIKLVEDTDTASTAQRIHQKQLLGIGAIGSKSAAELYNLNIIRHSIQTMKINATRFVILTTKEEKIDRNQVNKASLKFQVHHKRGSLATVLNVISDCRINMTKIQSLPVIETPWKYAFFVDIVFENYEDFEKAQKLLSIMAEDFKVLGIYKNALI
ncbi:Arogenate dehydratase/prephenate dehydratase 1 [Capnocytophaga canimorsus]|uniref:prephenate dehydratase n=1 Tax=Capnocytophaga canimorsus TaxID=28188 RepID=A0A0B7INE2_9FLAO|nr:prephenate dehydratase [Capnocytophaga canimorsus]CEN53345.1 Arogenate dehydratase/prephenate dehydratase 1 [Capnocytophaga canimorsus]